MTASESRAAGAAAEAVHHNTAVAAPVIALAGLGLGSEIMFDSTPRFLVVYPDRANLSYVQSLVHFRAL